MATLATLVVKLVGDISGFSSSMEDAGRRVSKFGSDISSIGGDLTAKVTLPLVGAGAAALLMGNKFNEGMANVVSLVPSATAEIEAMSDQVMDLAVEMGKSTEDMTGGLYQVVSAFGLTDDTLANLRTNAMAGAAGLASTTEAINLTSAVTKAYGDTSAAAVQQVADLAMQTVALGQTTFPELAASVGRVTPLAASMGVSMNELFGVMATGSGVTGSAAEVSTQFRGILQSLMAPTADMTAAFAELGVTSGEELISIHGLEDGLTNIMMIAEDSGKPLQSFIGSIEGQTLALALAGSQADTWGEKTQAMRDSAGAMADAFAAQTQGINEAGFSMAQLGRKVQVLAQRLGQTLGKAFMKVVPHLRSMLDFVERLVQTFVDLDERTQGIILVVAGVAAAIGPVLMVLGPMVTGFGGLVTVLGVLLSPIGLVVAAVVGLAAAFLALRNVRVREWLAQMWTGLNSWWDSSGSQWVRTTADKILQWLRQLPGVLAGLAGEAGAWLAGIWNSLRNWWDTHGSGWARGIADKIKAWLATVPDMLVTAGMNAVSWLENVWNQISTWWDEHGSGWASNIADRIGTAVGTVRTFLEKYMPQWVKDAVTWLSPVWMGMTDWWTDHAKPLTDEMLAGFNSWMTGQFIPALQNQDKSTWASGIGTALTSGFDQAIDYLYAPENVERIAYSIANFFSTALFRSISLVGEAFIGIPVLLLQKLMGKEISEDQMSPFIKVFESGLRGVVEGAIDGFSESALGGLIQRFFGNLINALRLTFTVGAPDLNSIGHNIIDGIKAGVIAKAAELVASVINAVNSALAAARFALGMKSPSLVFMEMGELMMQGMALGISSAARVPAVALIGAMEQLEGLGASIMTPRTSLAPATGRLDGRAAAGGVNVTIHAINVNGGPTNGETGRAVEMGVLRAARSLGLR